MREDTLAFSAILLVNTLVTLLYWFVLRVVRKEYAPGLAARCTVMLLCPMAIGMMESVGHCGDGYEWEIEEFGRKMINVPIAVPDFQIESELAYAEGIMGGNFWYMCSTKEAVLKAGRIIIDTIMEVEGVCTPFGICSAASKPETNFPEIGPSTNHPYCPSLKERLGDESKVPEGVNYIPEIVINATSEESMNLAIKKAIDAIIDIEGVERISAGNFEGQLGEHKTNLLDILND